MRSRSMHTWFLPKPGRRAAIVGCLALLGGAIIHVGDDSLALAEQSKPRFKLIVHPENKRSSEARQVVANMFLKRVVSWPTGGSVKPVDQLPTSDVREAFSKAALKRSVAAVRSYWQQRIFSGRDVPPPELESDAAVVKYVLEHEGAIGYVSSSAELRGARELALR